MSLSYRSYYFAGAIALLGIIGQWAGGDLLQLWRFPAALLILTLMYEWHLFRQQSLSLQYHISGALKLGCVSTFALELHNHSARKLSVETQIQFPSALDGESRIQYWSLNPQSSCSHLFNMVPVALGKFGLGDCYTRTLGCFGLLWWPRKLVNEYQVQVVPQSLSNTRFTAGSGSVGERELHVQQTGTGSELLSLRAYQAGDPLHAVDWKASARGQKPIVRVFSDEQHIELMILLDVGRGSVLEADGLSRLNHCINIAARLAEVASQAGDKVGLISYADQVIQATALSSGIDGLLKIRKHLQNLQDQPQESNPLSAALHLNAMLKHRGLVVFLTEIAEAEAASQLIKSISLLIPKHIPIIAGIRDKEIDDMRYRTPRHWLDPYRSFAALEYTQAMRHSAMNLRRLGGQVVLDNPEQLDRHLLSLYGRLRERKSV